MTFFKMIKISTMGLFVAALLSSCSDENAFSMAEDNLDDMEDHANRDFDDYEEQNDEMSEADKCYYGESYRSDSWCCSNYGFRCNYVSSSSYYRSSSSHVSSSSYYRSSSSYAFSSSYYHYSSSAKNETIYDDDVSTFLYRAYSVEIDLTWFRQLTDNWEKQKKHEGDYSDGDPSISFVIKTYADYTLKDSVKTEVFKLEDAGTWSGHKYFTKDFSGGVNEIDICPKVFERNLIESNVDHSSYYCYIIRDAGKNVNIPIMQSDNMATDFELEWTVRISYN